MSKDVTIKEQWKEQSLQRQDEFMKHLAGRLGRDVLKTAPQHPFRGSPEFWQSYQLDYEERISLFVENWLKASGHAERFKSMDEAKGFITDFCQETDAKSILLQKQEKLASMNLQEALPQALCTAWDNHQPDTMVEIAAAADVGVAVVDYAVAFTGSVVVKSDENNGRSTSLLPKVFIAIIPASTIKGKLGEVMTDLDQTAKDLPAGVHFISGPSRSADIENDLTIGVHGPGIVYALIVEDD